MAKNKKNEKETVLPGLEGFFPDQSKEEQEREEREFFKKFLEVIDADEFERLALSREETGYFSLIKEIAGNHQLPLPKNIERKLRQWKGENAFERIKAIAGQKLAIDLFEDIHSLIPLSTRGFEKIEKSDKVILKRKIGNREVKIEVGKPSELATGDLAKQALMSTFRFAGHRKTLDPGPIEFKELLEMIGRLECSQQERKNIKENLFSFARSSLEVRGTDERGRETYRRYAPFYKEFTWEGIGYKAKIYPIFNERIFKMILEEGLSQYIYINDSRLKRIKGLTDRDRLAQDQFSLMRGFSAQKIKMEKWLFKFGQFTEAHLETLSLPRIKAFVNKNFIQAKKDGLIKSYKIARFQNRKRYLNQIIFIFPQKPETSGAQLTIDQRKEIQDIAWLLHEAGIEDYANIEEETVEQYLLNIAKAGNFDLIKEAWEDVEDEADPDYPVDDYGKYQNRAMLFWNTYKRLRDAKGDKK